MKSSSLFTFCTIITVIVLISCNKDEQQLYTNKPPIAIAGPDQIITLTRDSIVLNGSASTDPDGKITSYKWLKISGPTNSTIIRSDSSKAVLKDLAKGVYKIELKVTDNGNLYSRDTMQILVNTLDTVNNTVWDCRVSMTAIGHLPTAGFVTYSISSGTKILFVRGSVIDIYDTGTSRWETVSGMFATTFYLPEQVGHKTAKVGSKLVFSAMKNSLDPSQGQIVNIYDAASNSWSTVHLTQARTFYAMAVVGNKVFYAGGNNDSQKMDIYDASSDSWSVADFNEARSTGMAAVGFGNKIYFAGGYIIRKDSLVQECDDFGNNCNFYPALLGSDRVDILDVSTNTWSVTHLSEGRGGISVALLENKIVFAGGEKPVIKNFFSFNSYSSVIDFYNTDDHSWTSSNLGSEYGLSGDYNIYTLNNKLLIPHGAYSNIIHIYNNRTNRWSVTTMPYPYKGDLLERGKIASVGDKMLFFNQYFDLPNYQIGGIDIYNASSNAWCHTQLNFNVSRMGMVKAGNSIYLAGGIAMTGCCTFNTPIDTMWRFNF